MDEKLGQEPAFSQSFATDNEGSMYSACEKRQELGGMSKRFYAAIKLRVPVSGEDWLDNMIIYANRRDAALAAMQGLLSGCGVSGAGFDAEWTAKSAFNMADWLLKQESE